MRLHLNVYENHAYLRIDAESQFEKEILSYVDSLKTRSLSVSVQNEDWNSSVVKSAAVFISFENTADRPTEQPPQPTVDDVARSIANIKQL